MIIKVDDYSDYIYLDTPRKQQNLTRFHDKNIKGKPFLLEIFKGLRLKPS